MAKENKVKSVQIRITLSEKQMMAKLKEANSDFNISRLFRRFLHKYYEKVVLQVQPTLVKTP